MVVFEETLSEIMASLAPADNHEGSNHAYEERLLHSRCMCTSQTGHVKCQVEEMFQRRFIGECTAQ